MTKLALFPIILVSSVAIAQPKQERRGNDPPKPPPPPTGTVSGTVKVTDDGKEVTGVDVVVYVTGKGLPDVVGADKVAATIKQTNDKKFVPDLVAITQGERVEFPNTGATLHNVFSQKPKFDLGSFSKGDTKAYQFKDKGLAEIYCNIHPEMAATVVVLPNPYHVSAKDGKFSIPNVPVGKWSLFAYTRRASKPTRVDIEVTASGATANLTIPRGAEAKHMNKYGTDYNKGGGYPR